LINEHGDMIAITAYYKLQAQVDELQRQLDNARTDWLCDTCDGRGCEAENQNTVLVAELEEQARLNGKGSEREAVLLAKVERLEREKALQGLHLATMADVVLGENAEDRSDDTLVREVCRIARENAALRAAAVETCALARVWATVWHDKLSTDSIQRFAELEQQILKKEKP
jgi:hypothetical protein